MTVDSVTEMTTRRRIEDIVREAIGEINETRSDALPLDKLDSLVLYGESGILDSLQLVNLLMSIEEKIADRIDVAASLTSDRAVSRRVSPFRSTTHLVDFILEEIGPAIYNQAVKDAQTRMQLQLSDLTGDLYADEFQYWPRLDARKTRRKAL